MEAAPSNLLTITGAPAGADHHLRARAREEDIGGKPKAAGGAVVARCVPGGWLFLSSRSGAGWVAIADGSPPDGARRKSTASSMAQARLTAPQLQRGWPKGPLFFWRLLLDVFVMPTRRWRSPGPKEPRRTPRIAGRRGAWSMK